MVVLPFFVFSSVNLVVKSGKIFQRRSTSTFLPDISTQIFDSDSTAHITELAQISILSDIEHAIFDPSKRELANI